VGRSCTELIEELRKFVGTVNVKVFYNTESECTVDYQRPEVVRQMRELSKESWIPSYGRGSFFLRENIGIEEADVAVYEAEEKKRQLEQLGCQNVVIHHHPELPPPYAPPHVHFSCKPLPNIKKLAEVMGG